MAATTGAKRVVTSYLGLSARAQDATALSPGSPAEVPRQSRRTRTGTRVRMRVPTNVPTRARADVRLRTRVTTNVTTRVPTAGQGRMRITTSVTTGTPVEASTVRVAPAGRSGSIADAPGVSDEQLPYELLAVPAGAVEAALRRIGRYRTYEEALRARDEDVIAQLAARGGWYTLIDHMIVGPGLRGPKTVHRHATALGVDPAAGRVPGPDDLDDARHWLAALRES